MPTYIQKFFQEFCLDLYQPSGMGKRRKRNDRSVNHGEVEYFYPIDKSRQNSRALEPRNQTNRPTSTANIDDNVGVTVIMPGGKFRNSTYFCIRLLNFICCTKL